MRKWWPDATVFGWFSVFFRKCVIHHCLTMENNTFTGKMINVLCYSTEFTSNICNLVMNLVDKTVSKLYRK